MELIHISRNATVYFLLSVLQRWSLTEETQEPLVLDFLEDRGEVSALCQELGWTLEGDE